MKKIREKTARRFMALLAAVCMLGTMPEMAVISHAEESVEELSVIYDADRQEDSDVEEQADGFVQDEEKPEEGEENPEDAEETKNKEESEDEEETGDSGADRTDKEDTSDKEEDEEGEKSEETPDEEQETEGEETDTEGEDSIEDEETAEDEEISEKDEATEDAEPEETEEENSGLLSLQSEDSGTVQDDSTYTDANGVIYHYYGYDDGTAEIYELESCMESSFRYKALDIPEHVGDYTVTRLTFTFSSTSQLIPSVTIPKTVTYMEGSLFKFMTILELYYNAEAAETGATGASNGVFFRGDIREFHLGENVRSIPDYCFDSTKMTIDKLTLNVESIGRAAFSGGKTITTLTIGENVKEIGYQAFTSNQIENIHYNVVNAAQSAQYGQLVSGPFSYSSVSNITIGDQVTMIPEHLFCNVYYTADTLVFPDCLTTVGAWAFYGSDITIGELTIGEDVTSIGEEAFARGKIGILNYNAIDARLDGVTDSNKHRTSFEGAKIGELRFGERVESLPDTLFYSIALTQDTLTLPDSITYIGSYLLSYSGGKVKIGTLEIGENVTHIGRAAFGCNIYDKVVVRTVEADDPPESDANYELPICSEIEIHRKSPYYEFFTRNTDKDHITLLCEDFETIRGEEYYDAGKKSFVTPITEACTVCGYGETRQEYSAACTVIFTDYDGRELSRQNLHKGDDAAAPEDPERTGYRFTGWDKDFTNVTSDLTVRAEYEIRKFSVVFKDGDRIISEQEVNFEDSAKVPANPTRPEEEWGSWRFTGWSGNYTNVTKDEVVIAQFEKAVNQYEVLFYDAEGNVISRQTVAHGEAAREPEAPEKEPTAQYNYTFTGWSADTESITGDTAFYPVYDTEIRFYTVTFMNGSTILDTQTVEYGDDATAPEDPTRPEEDWGRWEFTGWSGSYTNITRDEVIRAAFEKVLNEYEVIFYDAEDNILSRQTVKHGMGAEAPEVPDIEPTERECYVFVGWDGDVSNITGESQFHPLYETKARTYTVTFMNGDTPYNVQKVEYGVAAVTPSDPTKEEDETYTYRFIGWDQDYSFIIGDLTVHAMYDAVEKPEGEDPGQEKPKEDEKEKEKPKDKEPGGKVPGDGDGENGEEPDNGTDNDDGQTDGESVEDVVEETIVPVPEVVTALLQKAQPQISYEKKLAFSIPEIPDEAIQQGEPKIQAEEPGEQVTPQEVETEDVENVSRHMPGWLWLLLFLGAGTGLWGIWLLLFGAGERTVCGTVLDGEGNAMSGIKATLTGQEGEPVETQTDEDGQYLFEDLKKDSYRLWFCDTDASGLLLLDIRMERRGHKKEFCILKSNVNAVETKRCGGKYQVDVTV